MLDFQDKTNVDADGVPFTHRSVYVVDPDNIIRASTTYPLAVGRNFNEILRLVDSLRLCDLKKVATPANWNRGDPVFVLNDIPLPEAQKKFPGLQVVKPYYKVASLK